MFGLFRWWKRRRLLKREFPPEWMEVLRRRVPFYRRLPDDLKEVFKEQLKLFAWEKGFFGADGMTITDEVRVVVSACAVRLTLTLDLSHYDRLTEIVVYPGAFRSPDRNDARLGEAHQWGVVVLSWAAVLEGLEDPDDGQATGAHEFAHVLDVADGTFDGTPTLREFGDYSNWAVVMTEHFSDLRRGGRRSGRILDEYGALNEAEFFAVATEAFFERPRRMRRLVPELYTELRRFYGWDPGGVGE